MWRPGRYWRLPWLGGRRRLGGLPCLLGPRRPGRLRLCLCRLLLHAARRLSQLQVVQLPRLDGLQIGVALLQLSVALLHPLALGLAQPAVVLVPSDLPERLIGRDTEIVYGALKIPAAGGAAVRQPLVRVRPLLKEALVFLVDVGLIAAVLLQEVCDLLSLRELAHEEALLSL